MTYQLDNNITNRKKKMDATKSGRQILPQSFEQYQMMKKKQIKANSLIRSSMPLDYGAMIDLKNSGRDQKDSMDDDSDEEPMNYQIKEKILHSDYQKMLDNFHHNKFEEISTKISSEINKLKEQPPVQIISINDILKDLGIQSFQNIMNIQTELKAPVGRRNNERLDAMLSFNKFFVILNRQKRYRIYDNCHLIVVEEGKQIYTEGQVDDYMYVVVKGCVKQYEKQTTSFNQKITVNFVSHYEGSHFGETQLIGDMTEKSKRYHNTIATQKCYLLKIENEFYRELITHSVEDDFEKKINTLLSTSMFSETSKIFITPLLSTLKKHVLSLGDVLIRQGEILKKLYFVSEGGLQIVYIDRQKKNIKHLNIEEKPANFYVNGKVKKKVDKKNRNFSIHQTFYYPEEMRKDNKEFLYGSKKVVGNMLQYNDHVAFTELRSGDFLGGKSFLSSEQRIKKATQEQFYDERLETRLSAISSSIQTIVYSLDEKKFFSLSDNLQKVMIDSIRKLPYFDQRDIETKVKEQREQKEKSEKEIAKIIRDKKERNKSFRL